MTNGHSFELIMLDDGHFFSKVNDMIMVRHYHPEDVDCVQVKGMFTAKQLRHLADVLDEHVASVAEAA